MYLTRGLCARGEDFHGKNAPEVSQLRIRFLTLLKAQPAAPAAPAAPPQAGSIPAGPRQRRTERGLHAVAAPGQRTAAPGGTARPAAPAVPTGHCPTAGHCHMPLSCPFPSLPSPSFLQGKGLVLSVCLAFSRAFSLLSLCTYLRHLHQHHCPRIRSQSRHFETRPLWV